MPERELREWTAAGPVCTCGCARPRTHGVWFGGDAPVLTGCEWAMQLAAATGIDALARLERTARARLVQQPTEWEREHRTYRPYR